MAAGLYTSVATSRTFLPCLVSSDASLPHAVVLPTPWYERGKGQSVNQSRNSKQVAVPLIPPTSALSQEALVWAGHEHNSRLAGLSFPSRFIVLPAANGMIGRNPALALHPSQPLDYLPFNQPILPEALP